MTLENLNVPRLESKRSSIIVTAALMSDFDDISAIHRECWLNTYVGIDGINSEDVYCKFNQRVNNFEKFKSQLLGNKIVLVARDASKNIVGFGISSSEGSCNFLESLYVKPDSQNIGIGKKILYELIVSLDGELPIITRSVIANTKAVNFYKSIGFSETGEFFYGPEMPITKSRMKSTRLRVECTKSLLNLL